MQETLNQMAEELRELGTSEARIEKILRDFVEQQEAIEGICK